MIEQADHLRANANMWRITNDLWDSWGISWRCSHAAIRGVRMYLRDVIRIVI